MELTLNDLLLAVTAIGMGFCIRLMERSAYKNGHVRGWNDCMEAHRDEFIKHGIKTSKYGPEDDA